MAKSEQSQRLGVTHDPRWARIVSRDKGADGEIWYSVLTTAVYCRASCPSRTPNPRNVQLHDSLEAAQATGFRPCKRCRPHGPSQEEENATLIGQACRFIEDSEEEPSLKVLAAAMGRSASHLHRVFKASTGLTPKGYAQAHRAARVREGLSLGHSVTETIYEAGFNSSGRFYENAVRMLGMTPSNYKSGGVNEQLLFAVGESSLGAILVASSRKGVTCILLGDDPEALVQNLQDRFPKAELIGADQDYEQLVARVVGFSEAPNLGLGLPLDIRGTAFQERVWGALQKIPCGQTASYSQVAQLIGSPSSVRAVAGACAANNLAVAIPCHRVVRRDGSLSGYAWGVDRKQKLLAREAQPAT